MFCFNADYHTYRGLVLKVKHIEGAKYRDLWNELDLKPRIEKGQALLSVEIGPRQVGCVARINH